MKFKVSAVLPLPAEQYFVERDSAAFRSLVAQMCKLEALEMGESWMEGDTEVYEFVTKPDIERYVPSQFKHFLPGGDLHYTDVISYAPKLIARSPYKMRVHSIPPIFSNKAKIESWLVIEEVTPTTCRQTLEGEIEIKILGLGHLAEKIVVDNLKGVYKGVPKIAERWARFREEVMKQPGGKDILVQGRPKNASVDWINDQIKELIQAPETDSDTASVSSAPTSDSARSAHLPSMEEMVANCSLEEASSLGPDDADEFFDAREDASWADLNGYLSTAGTGAGDRKIEKDNRDARDMLRHVTKSGRRFQKIEVDAATRPKGTRAGKLDRTRVRSERFSTTYNEDLAEWKDFWQEHKVPESKHAPDVKGRLGNLFNIGAAMGIFKPSKHHHHRHLHLRKKHREKKHHHDDSQGSSVVSELTDASEFTQTMQGRPSYSEDGVSTHGKDGHRPHRSAAFVRELFGGKKRDANSDASSHKPTT